MPTNSQAAYLAIRAFNIETSRIADTVSTPQVGLLRLQFWKDNITRSFTGSPPQQPICVLLSSAISSLSSKTNGRAGLNKAWFLKILSAREQYLTNPPYPSLTALEQYAENTYSTLLYLTLQSLPLSSLTADHLASHIGKAAGISTVLRGLPLIAFPASPNHHSNTAGLSPAVIDQRASASRGSVTLPLDVMADAGVREEDVLRQGAEAPGLRDAVFAVATRASDHLITARTMLANLRKGEEVGHAFEHEGEEGHTYSNESSGNTSQQALQEAERAFGVLMPVAIGTQLWLERLQNADFDVFDSALRRREWKLPWRAYLAHKRRTF